MVEYRHSLTNLSFSAEVPLTGSKPYFVAELGGAAETLGAEVVFVESIFSFTRTPNSGTVGAVDC